MMRRVSFGLISVVCSLISVLFVVGAQAVAAVDKSAQLTAKPTTFQPGVLYDGGDFTSVEVTVTNTGTEDISINPLYFTITAADGGKHTTTLGEDERQIDTLDLASGEHVTGVITAKGSFEAKRVTYSVDGFGAKVVADVK